MSRFVQKNKYNNSFSLTRSTRIRVQHLLKKYKEQQMGNIHFEDRSRHLRDLPLLSTDFNSWFQLSDWDRLHRAFTDIQTYWSMLERKRKQLEKEQNVQRMATSLLQSIKHIQLDLRDLMSQVSSQMKVVRSSWVRPTPAAALQNLQRSSRTVWESRVEGYIILRDLDLYLTKLARDFLLLASKTHL
ncbi:hypothetical protein ATANTOWER_018298 [Ataeniobius toweri]|uniref:Ciliary neurotrophic factor n=1 Tax=Ataeniobius toweri TaxID=208326 RepID=A0ABU7CBW9_9TELE|nr:hypothetical protein [Ataeniobius toweri]